MFGRNKKKPSENIKKFVDRLYQFEKEHPYELCPMETDPQFVVDSGIARGFLFHNEKF